VNTKGAHPGIKVTWNNAPIEQGWMATDHRN
jgi:hypothetical protein